MLRFDSDSSLKKCEKTVNSMIKNGWYPVDLSFHTSPDSEDPIILVMMGYPAPASDGSSGQEVKSDEGLVKGYERCPNCGNLALEVEVDHSARCEYCGHISTDIRKELENDDYVY